MQFDSRKYREVLKDAQSAAPLIDRAIRDVKAATKRSEPVPRSLYSVDLAKCYAVTESMARQELSTRLKTVKDALVKSTRPIATSLLQLYDALSAMPAVSLDDPLFWRNAAEQYKRHTQQRAEEILPLIVEQEKTRVLTHEELSTMLADAGGQDIDLRAAEALLVGKGFFIGPDISLPSYKMPNVLKQAYRGLRAVGGASNLARALLLDSDNSMSDICVVDYFGLAGRPAITSENITNSKLRVQKLKDSNAIQALKKLLDVADSLKLSSRELHAVALLDAAERAEDSRQKLVTEWIRALVAHEGYAELDARRLVKHLIESRPSASSGPTLEEAKSLLAEGELESAQHILDVVRATADPDALNEIEQLESLILKRTAARDALLDEYRDAKNRFDFRRATAVAQEALAIDSRLDWLSEELLAFPPPPVQALSVSSDDTAIVLRWSGSDNTVFSVVRSLTAAPSTPTEGDLLIDRGRSTTFVDRGASPGGLYFYSVFASRENSAYSSPNSVKHLYLPQVTNIRTQCTKTAATLFFRVPHGAAAVVVAVMNANGTVAKVKTTSDSVQLRDLSTGVPHKALIYAEYLTAAGVRQSNPIEAAFTPRQDATAVGDLDAYQASDAATGTFAASWGEVQGYEVALWNLPISVEPRHGEIITGQELERIGATRLLETAHRRIANGRVQTQFECGDSLFKVAALVQSPLGYLVSNIEVLGSAPPVDSPTAVYLDGQVKLSWEWPRGVRIVEIQWTQNGESTHARSKLSAYRRTGGFAIGPPDPGSSISLRSVYIHEGVEISGPLTQVPDTWSPLLSAMEYKYTAVITRRWFGTSTVQIHVEGTPNTKFDARLLTSTSAFKPRHPNQSRTLKELSIELDGAGVWDTSVDVSTAPKKSWFILWTSDEDVLLTPLTPIASLRG